MRRKIRNGEKQERRKEHVIGNKKENERTNTESEMNMKKIEKEKIREKESE